MSNETPERRHIALLLRSLTGSGTSRVMLKLAGEMAARGHRVDVLVCHKGRGCVADEVPETVERIDLQPRSRWPALVRLEPGTELVRPLLQFSDAGYLGPVADYLRTHQPDALLSAANFANALALLGRRLARTSTRVVVSQHMNLSQQIRRPRKGWKLAMARALYPEADAVVTVSQGVQEDLAELLGVGTDRIQKIYNPVVFPSLREMAKEPTGHPWLEDEGPPVVLAAGKLTRRKDFAMLVQAMRSVCASLDARLVILGEGEERAALEKLARRVGIADAVSLPGFQANPYAFMSRAAVLALPSRWEGLGNVLIEALACGCPVVSTDCPSGPVEILKGGRYGALVPVGDHEGMAGAIVDAISKPPPRALLEARGEEFSCEVAASAYLSLLLESPVAMRRAPNEPRRSAATVA